MNKYLNYHFHEKTSSGNSINTVSDMFVHNGKTDL